MLLEGRTAEAVGANQPRVKDFAASLRNRHASQLRRGRTEGLRAQADAFPAQEHAAQQWDQSGSWAPGPSPPRAWLERCASQESKKTNTAGSSEMDCDWLRRLEVTKRKLRNNQIRLPASDHCRLEFMFRNETALQKSSPRTALTSSVTLD